MGSLQKKKCFSYLVFLSRFQSKYQKKKSYIKMHLLNKYKKNLKMKWFFCLKQATLSANGVRKIIVLDVACFKKRQKNKIT